MGQIPRSTQRISSIVDNIVLFISQTEIKYIHFLKNRTSARLRPVSTDYPSSFSIPSVQFLVGIYLNVLTTACEVILSMLDLKIIFLS